MPEDLPEDVAEKISKAYRDLAEYIGNSEGNCVLVLGPELAVDAKGFSYRRYFRQLRSNKNMGIFDYFEEENLFSFKDEAGYKDTRREVKQFYKSSGDQPLLEMIARIRFPLIINTCPDLAINEVYKKAGIPFKSGYFSKDSKPKFLDLPYPSKEQPVIYNIFGCVEPDTSLILNHAKLYETIQYLLPDNSLPESIERYLNEVSGFILLGLQFNSWHYQLLCHKLKLNDYGKIRTSLSASGIADNNSVSLVMRKHFAIDFAPDNPAQAVARLIEECANYPETLRDINGHGSVSLFVSYAWRDKDAEAVNRETVVDCLEKDEALNSVSSLLFYRDHNDLSFGDSIDSFMTRIGKGKTVIRVISDKYLKSRYCMTEAIRINGYRDDDKRVFNIVWEDADLDNEIHYRDFWLAKSQAILQDLEKKLDNDNYDHAVQIYRFLPQFINGLKDGISLRVGKNDFELDAATGQVNLAAAKKAEFSSFIKKITSKLIAT
jgi:TIR domain/SIR2-like domain